MGFKVLMLGVLFVVASLMLVKVNGEELKVRRWQTPNDGSRRWQAQAETRNGIRRWQNQHKDPKSVEMKNHMQGLRGDNRTPKYNDFEEPAKHNDFEEPDIVDFPKAAGRKCPRVNRDYTCAKDGLNEFHCHGCNSKKCKCEDEDDDKSCRCQ